MGFAVKTWLKVLSISFALIAILQQASVAQWVSSSTGITVNSMYCFEKVGSALYVGTEGGGVFVSTDGGSNWTATNSGLTNLSVIAVLASGSNLFAATVGGGVFLSTNGGSSWTAVNTGLTTLFIYSLAANGGNIYAGTGSAAVFKSTNNGANWTASGSGITNSSINALISSGANLFAGTNNGIFLSTNLGTSWTPVNTGLTFTFITSLFAHGTNIYASTSSQGVFLSTNNGGNWTQMNTGLTNLATTGFASSGSNVFCSTYNGVFLSTNSGTNWNAVTTGLGSISVYTMTVFGPYAYAGTLSNKVFRRPLSEMVAVSLEVTSFTPPSGPAGTNVTINGNGFSGTLQGTVVRFGGAQATVSNVTTTSITVHAPPNATYAPIAVTSANKTASSRNPFIVTFSGGGIGPSSFEGSLTVADPVNAQWLFVADMDGDGKCDLIAPRVSGNYVSVFRNISTGSAISFATTVDFSTAWFGVKGGAIGDVDGDGKLDMVIADAGAASPGRISVFRNTSTPGSITSGSFATTVNFSVPTGFILPNDIALADFNGDGKLDIAACGVDLSSNYQVYVYKNTSTVGSITSSSFADPSSIPTGSGVNDIDAADFDGDGKVDLVTSNTGANSIMLYRNVGLSDSNIFASPITITMSGPWRIAVGDLDGDGRPDIVASNSQTSMMVLKNVSVIGDITFNPAVAFTTPNGSYVPAIGDLDGDSKPDIAITNTLSNTVSVFRNRTSGSVIDTTSFGPRIDYDTPQPFAVVLGDLDGDGKPEVTISTSQTPGPLRVLRNRVSVGFVPTPVVTGTSDDLGGVFFQDPNNGYISGKNGTVRKTTNGGQTWTASTTGTVADLTDIKFVGSTGFITGNGGLICKTTDNGTTWVPFTTGTSEKFNGASFVGPASGWAVGTNGTICVYNGSGWTPQSTGTTEEFKGVFALGSTGWAVGSGGTICKYNGTSWVPQSSGTTTVTFNDVAFVDLNTGYAVGSGGAICKTTNGGTTWNPLNPGLGIVSVRKIKLVNANTGWAVCDGGAVAQTTDGGNTWTTTYLGTGGNLGAIEVVGGKGVIVGDGGKGYTFTSDVLSDVHEIDPGNRLPETIELMQNYPNPFNPTTKMRFTIRASGLTSLRVYDVLGQEVATLVNENLKPGTFEATFDATNLASGVYFYTLKTRDYSTSKRMILLK